jgi:lysophospholipase L1-like esterase
MLKVSTPDGKLTRLVDASQRQEYLEKGWIIEDTSEVEMMLDADGNTMWRYKEDTEWNTISGTGGGDTYKVKVDGTDTADYLENKLQQGTNVTITKSGGKLVVNSIGGGGGVTVYADLAAIKAVDTTSVTSGTLAQVVTLGQFVFDSTSTATGDDVAAIQPITGSGRWLLQADSKVAIREKTTTPSTVLGASAVKRGVVSETGIIKDIAVISPFSEDGTQLYKKRIITIGDSNMAGWFLSTADKQLRYVIQLKDFLATNYGSELIDVSISGNTTTAMAQRFWKDIVPYKPDLVIVSLSLTNRQLDAKTTPLDVAKVVQTEKLMALRIIDMLKTIKSDYIIIGYYPRTPTTEIGLSGGLELNEYFRNVFGDKYIDVHAMLADDSGNIATRYDNGDGLHFNKLAHDAIYARLRDLYTLTRQSTPVKDFILPKCKGIKLPMDVTTTSGLYHNFLQFTDGTANLVGTNLGFSAGVEVLPPATVLGVKHNLMQFQFNFNTLSLNVSTTDTLEISYKGTNILTTSKILSKTKTSLIVVTYTPATKTFKLFINDELIGTSSAIADEFQMSSYENSVYLGCGTTASLNASGYTFRNWFHYKHPITLDNVKSIKAGVLSPSGLEFYNPLNSVRKTYINYANSTRGILTNTDYAIIEGSLSDNEYTDTEKTKLANIPTGWTQYTPTVGVVSGTAPTTTGVSLDCWYKLNRAEKTCTIKYHRRGSASATAGTGTYTFSMPSGVQIDTAICAVDGQITSYVQGNNVRLASIPIGFGMSNLSGESAPLTVHAASATTFVFQAAVGVGGAAANLTKLTGSSWYSMNSPDVDVYMEATVPIV